MKLGAMMVAQTLDQYDAKVIPESHPAVTQLSQRFGEHTFFIDGSGLNIVEPSETDEQHQTGVVVTWRVITTINRSSWCTPPC